MSKVKNILIRLSLFYWLIFLFAILITGKIILLQFFSPEYITPELRKEVVQPVRGNILSHDGRVLATSHVSYKLIMDFATPALKNKFKGSIKELSVSLAAFFKDKSAERYEKELRHADSLKVRRKSIGNRSINYLELQEVKKFPLYSEGRNISGLIPEAENKREYPYLSFAKRTIGSMDKETSTGNKGIEGYYEQYLRGVPGERMVQASSQGPIPIDNESDKSAEDGYDVVTAIDINIQDAVEIALINQLRKNRLLEAGTAIVMEVETGEIRGIANISLDANGQPQEILNYAVSRRNAPGSTFKLATLIALLEDGHINLNTTVDTEGRRARVGSKIYTDVTSIHGIISVLKAFSISSNIAFAKLVYKYYPDKEKQKGFVKHFQNMGLDSPFNLDISEMEGKPEIPHPDKGGWYKISATQVAIGYEVNFAPIHTLALFNAVANNGKMVKPKFVVRLEKHGQTVKTFPTEVICSSICSPSTLEKVKKALVTVVKEGTAKHIDNNTYQIAGKTGTARILFPHSVTKKDTYQEIVNGVEIKKNQPSFAGYFPADNPKYTIVVVFYSHKTKDDFHGGTWAAPVFKEISDKIYAMHPEWLEKVEKTSILVDLPSVKGGKSDEVITVLNQLNIPHNTKASNNDWVKTKISDKKIEVEKLALTEIVPSVVNMGLKDALYILENLGLDVKYTGRGTVRKQSIQAGSKAVKGQSITLTLEV